MNRLFLLLFGAMSLVAHAQVPNYVPTDGLVAWYPFNGNANDESGNGNHGVIEGAELTSDRFNQSNSAFYVPPGSSVNFGEDQSFAITSEHTVSIGYWFYANNGKQPFLAKYLNSEGWDSNFYVGPQFNGNQIVVTANGSNAFVWPIADGWNHALVIYSGEQSEAELWCNGESVFSGQLNFNVNASSQPFLLHSFTYSGEHPNPDGIADDIGFWNRALTEAEISALYNAELPVPGCTDSTACNFDAEANEDDGSCLSTLELSLQNQIQISSEGELVLTAPETLQNWTWDNGTSDSSIPIGSGGTFSIQGVIGVIPEIGSELNEGLIFDIDSLNQIVYIASPEEIGTGSEWGCYGTSTGATGQGMGDGLTNTQLILENCSDDNSAAAVASEYGENWYLPSFEELNAIRTQLHDSGFGDYSMNNPLSINWYWSSTECSENPDWAAGSMHFFDGFYGACNNKNSNPGGVIAAKMVQGGFCLFTDTITIEVDCSESNDLSANGTSCGPGTYWDELESLCLPIENCQDDLDGDGVIGINDLMQLLSSFGTMCEEPETVEFTCGDPMNYHGYDYATVQIGEQCWFAENLRTELYQNGDAIPLVVNDIDWDNIDGDAARCSAAPNAHPNAGQLYTFFVVSDERGVCPSDWHVPSHEEWIVLELDLGLDPGELENWGESRGNLGLKMKSCLEWNGDCSMQSGFNAVYSSIRPGNGPENGDYSAQEVSAFWSSTPNVGAWYRSLKFNSSGIHAWYDGDGGDAGFSVRCLKD